MWRLCLALTQHGEWEKRPKLWTAGPRLLQAVCRSGQGSSALQRVSHPLRSELPSLGSCVHGLPCWGQHPTQSRIPVPEGGQILGEDWT